MGHSTGKTTAGRFILGTSGWDYPHWRDAFYPDNLPRRDWFDHYATIFRSVEINNTFYRLPGEATFERWRKYSPPGFTYALKFSRYGSHIKRLKDAADTIAVFMERAERLGRHLGAILVQLPPRWHANPERLADFLARAPGKQRWAVEFRDADWLRPEVMEVLERHGAALCIHDLLAEHPWTTTTDWTYLRFHGMTESGDYSPQFLSSRADRITEMLLTGLDVYCYFNNDDQGFAPNNALRLERYVRHRLRARHEETRSR